MLILSWNIAGLSTTINRINNDYGSLQKYFLKHHADIVCLQEHKIPLSQLKHRTEPSQASTLSLYESFWSCCTHEKQKGFNGVVTYCKKGTVLSANAQPLNDPDLDSQGRCLLTNHGNFVLFNVYAPSGGNELAYRMKFLRALERAMLQQTKPVILVGDMNIARGKYDIFWKDRVIYVDEIRHDSVAWKRQVQQHWPRIQDILVNKKVQQTQTRNTKTDAVFQKYRMTVPVDGRTVYLGSHETSPEYCEYVYNFEEQSYFDEETNEQIIVQRANTVSVEVLAEVMAKIANVEWDEDTLQQIAEEATVKREHPTRIWFEKLLENRVDVFRLLYPNAHARFTCWNQSKNRRYVNDGARIDYTIVDPVLVNKIIRKENEILRGTRLENKHDSEKAALEAATANGLFEAVGFEGGGLKECSHAALDSQFGEPHTGMIYTPPTYSDHIGVSILLEDDLLPTNLVLDKACRKAQPHKSQASIASFFSKGPTQTKRPIPVSKSSKKKTKPSILDHFKPGK